MIRKLIVSLALTILIPAGGFARRGNKHKYDYNNDREPYFFKLAPTKLFRAAVNSTKGRYLVTYTDDEDFILNFKIAGQVVTMSGNVDAEIPASISVEDVGNGISAMFFLSGDSGSKVELINYDFLEELQRETGRSANFSCQKQKDSTINGVFYKTSFMCLNHPSPKSH